MSGGSFIRDRPFGVTFLAGFFAFGAAMCALTMVLLLFPGSRLDLIWRFNPGARLGFASIGAWAIPAMAGVGTACALSSVGLGRLAEWGRRLAIAVLSANLAGDAIIAAVRHDPRTLVGLPLGAAMIWYLQSGGVRSAFIAASRRHVGRPG